VIGVLTPQRRSEWVLFELGQAWANSRQILLIAPPKSIGIPAPLQRFLVVRASLKNRDAISFALDQILAAPRSTPTLKSAKRIEQGGLGARTDVLLATVRTAIAFKDSSALQQVMALALRDSGVDVLAEQGVNDRRVDLAIWSDELQPFVGNPLLVEIKICIRDQNQARTALRRLSLAIEAGGTLWGLFLYGECSVSEQKLWTSAPPNILVISLSSLLEQMRNRPFTEIVRDLRNRRVHGGLV
jgi:hypothetical protein